MPTGTELATAWVRIVPSFDGVQTAVTKGFSGASAAANAEGTKAGHKFTEGASKGLAKLGGVLVAAFAVNKIIDGFNATVKAASDLQEAGNSVGAVFGDSFRDIEKFSKSAAASLGLSQLEALNAAKTFGIFGQAAGLAGEENVKFSIGMAQLAADLASFHNTSPEEAIIALGAALRGENEPIRRFGILLDDATLRQKALELGLIATTRDALTPQQKVLAAHAAIMEQSGVAQGDFARTSENLANQQRILNAEWTNFTAELGEAFLPMMTDVVSGLNEDLIPALRDMLTVLGDIQKEDWFRGLLDALGEGGSLDLVGGGFLENLFPKDKGAQFWADFEAITQTGVTNIRDRAAEGLAGMSQDQSLFYKSSTDGNLAWWAVTDTNTAAGSGRVAATTAAGLNVQTNWFVGFWGGMTKGWNLFWDTVNGFVSMYTTIIIATVTAFINGLTTGFRVGWSVITGVFTTAAATVTNVVNGVLGTMQRVANGIREAFAGIGDFIRGAFGAIGDVLGGVAGAFNGLFGSLGDKARHFKGRLSALVAARQAQLSSGGAGVGAPGTALARVQSILGRFPGLRITDTLSSPARDAAFGIVRSPNSYHYDANNPAVDIAGPIPVLHQLAALLYSMGGWRQILWQVAGHYDHIHVAHGGGRVESSWPRMWGDSLDERTVRLQVGETVLPKGYEPISVQAWQPDDFDGRGDGGRSSGPAVNIEGDVYTTDIDEFFERAERARKRAIVLEAPVTAT